MPTAQIKYSAIVNDENGLHATDNSQTMIFDKNDCELYTILTRDFDIIMKPHLTNLNEESNFNGLRSTNIGDQVSNYGNGNGFKIGASAETSDNTFGKRFVTLNRGLNSQGDGNSFVIGL